MKKIIVIRFLIALVVMLAIIAAVVFVVLSRQHNLLTQLTAKDIAEDQTVDVDFWREAIIWDSDNGTGFSGNKIPVFKFTPAESDL